MNSTLFQYPCISKYECHSIRYVFEPGLYKVELWGGSGGFSKVSGGSGGFVSGYITFWNSTETFLYIGSEGHQMIGFPSFNGGGKCQGQVSGDGGGGTGGGGTDIRLIDSMAEEGLASRIIVAGGGGGAEAYKNGATGGDAGGLIGFSGKITSVYENPSIIAPGGGTQYSGGDASQCSCQSFPGSLGNGGNGAIVHIYGGGGGGGYFGGGGGTSVSGATTSGGGGSSFISGHIGCKAISETFQTTESPLHYSGLFFTKSIIKDGSSFFLNPDGIIRQGNRGDGAIRISRIDINKLNLACSSGIQLSNYNSIFFISFIYLY